ncbi:MAG: AAA family ATPase [Deltaproteobacteria bacterium]|nr:AAA family ATPase [Deltaproteobacteria bacterium]
MLRTIQIRNFKSFDDSGAVELEPLTVLFGPNAAGKSNFIDALLLTSRLASERTLADAFGGPIRGRVIEAFRFGPQGLPGLLTQDRATLGLEVTLTAANEGLRYRTDVALLPRSGELTVEDEYLATLTRGGDPKGNPSIERVENHLHVRRKGKAARPYKIERGSFTQLADRRFSGPGYRSIERCRNELSSWRAYYLDPRVAMRSAQAPQEVFDIGALGEHVAPFLYRLRSTEGGKPFKAVVRTLRTIIPTVEDLNVELNTQRGEVELTIVQDGVACPARVVSEGTLRVLALACIAVNPFGGAVVAFEEPENGVHPRRIELIAKLLVEMGRRGRQLVVTTHSPVFCAEVMRLSRTEKAPIRMYNVLRERGASRLKRFELTGPLFQDAELRQALADPSDETILEAAMVRGLLDG